MGSGVSTPKTPGGSALPLELPSLKIALVGDPGVGKTSVLLRYLRNQFSPLYVPTKKVAIENVVRKLNVPAHTVVSMTFWDIPGREDMDLHKSYFRNLDAAIVVVDLTNKATIDMANVWKQTVLNKLTRLVPTEISNNGEQLQEVPVSPVNFPVLLLGNKFDIIEEEIYHDLANRQVSASLDVNGEIELRHGSVAHLESVAEQHNFIGSVAVSAKQSDNSVTMAIQSMVRNILEKRNIPRKWKAVPEKVKPPKKDRPFIYDKLEKTDIEKQDEVIDKADGVVKETVVLRHYFTVSYARFQHACKKGSIVAEDEPSLEDCIFGLKQAAKKGTHIKICEEEGFVKIGVSFDDDKEIKQTKPWKQAYRIFHNEYVAVGRSIMKEGPKIEMALEKFDNAMEKMLQEYTEQLESTNEKKDNKKKIVAVTNKIIRNRAKIQHSRDAMREAMKDVEMAAKKMMSVDLW
ncbi:uncharacterized protein LOC132753797 isoform X2 [Ruditapes philippinarum]|uniref:uncharacterized protein LOC132753797 isoform X2 n=1 Tax=Ruditapes philippinarum TaxID=129788 RepID=UPI00295B384C|nr:uncharacterized protein LOC132753797 isoform X2 [Ruditapes philippinarum]